ncbi:hypothetical protein D3C86_1925770 [compost metagenome]
MPSVSAAVNASSVRSGQATCASASETPPLTSVSTEAKSVAAWAIAAPERPRANSEVSTIFFMFKLHVDLGGGGTGGPGADGSLSGGP